MSIKEIKRITGFSYSTISRVLSGKAEEFRISKKTCQAILRAAEKLDYRPNMLARSLRLRRTMTIGLMVSDIQNPFFGELGSRIERLLREHGYSTFLCNTNELPENEEFYMKILHDRRVDGIIVTPVHTTEWGYMKSLRREPPIVLIDRVLLQTKLPWVTSENTAAAERLTEELVDLGSRRIAFLGGIPGTYISKVRYQGYQNALRKRGLRLERELVFFKGYSAEAGEEMMTKALELRPDLDAVFCVNNLVFFGATRVVREYEQRQGRQLMMAGFDIGHYRRLLDRPLITADQDLDALAHAAVNLLLSLINRTPLEKTQLMLPITLHRHRLE